MLRICRTCLMVKGMVMTRMTTVSRMIATPICLPLTTYSNINIFSVGRMISSFQGLNPADTMSPSRNAGSPKTSKDVTSQQPAYRLVAYCIFRVEAPNRFS